MIYTAIYKIKLHKSTQRLYNLWGKPLIALQNKYIKTIERMLGRWYKETLQTIKDNPDVKINDLMIDQEQFIDKTISNSDFEEYSEMMTSGFNIGAKQLNQAFKKDIKVEATFGLDPGDALQYANDKAGERIKGVDDYSKKRINDLVSQGVEKGWWYNKLATELKRDFAFSPYRARLIASQEIGEAYLRGKENQFNRYRKRFNQNWWKKWVSHYDDRTTDWCRENHDAWWIEFDKEFPSGHMAPTRFPWCRCNCVYRLFDPTADGDDTLTIENATPSDEIQSFIPEDWADGIKPTNYDEYSTKVLPPSYFNDIGTQANYIKPKKGAYYQRQWDIINIGKYTNTYQAQRVEVHEVGHFFLTRSILPNEARTLALKQTFEKSVEEVAEFIKDKEMRVLFVKSKYNHPVDMAQKVLDKYKDLKDLKWYSVKEYEKEIKRRGRILKAKVREMEAELSTDFSAFLDTIGAITKEIGMGQWHSYWYYANSTDLFVIGGKKFTEKQVQEFFAHLNEVHWLGNPIIEKFLPETYKAMKSYYASIDLDFIT